MITKEIDYLNLKQIAESGQCFRWRKLDDDKYMIPAFGRCLTISQSDNRFEMSCDEKEFEEIWSDYFDLHTDYGEIIGRIDSSDKFLKAAAEYGKGIRILNQELWETIISFIISQNNNIPRIKGSIEKLCSRYNVQSPYNEDTDICMIPHLSDIEAHGGRESLSDLGLGYRDEYIWLMCNYENEHHDFEEYMRSLDYEQSLKYLMSFKGVGKKVANCICLFGLHHLDACPIDVWMKKIIDDEYGGIMPAWMTDKYAGVYQQYTFFYKRRWQLCI